MVSFNIMKCAVHVRHSVKGEQSCPSKLSDDVLESIELFKLAKPSIYGWEIHERLLRDRICDRQSTGSQNVT